MRLVNSFFAKIMLVALVAALIYSYGVTQEGKPEYSTAIFMMWYIHFFSSLPNFEYGDLGRNLIYAATNGFHFYGAIFCIYLVFKYISGGKFKNPGRVSMIVLSLVAVFAISTIWFYVDMFLYQERDYFTKDYVFATEYSMKAINAWDGIICVAILLQIAQAAINTGLKRVLKR